YQQRRAARGGAGFQSRRCRCSPERRSDPAPQNVFAGWGECEFYREARRPENSRANLRARCRRRNACLRNRRRCQRPDFCRNGEVDFAAFEKLAEVQIAAGITGVIAVGTTGESPTLTHDEKHEVIERAIKIANGRCKVIAGAGTNSTRDSIEATKFAEKAGADGALLVAPYYNKPSQEGLFRHFKAIAGATSLPVMLYNIPGRCAVDIAADT